jgi:hypothetical protein
MFYCQTERLYWTAIIQLFNLCEGRKENRGRKRKKTLYIIYRYRLRDNGSFWRDKNFMATISLEKKEPKK